MKQKYSNVWKCLALMLLMLPLSGRSQSVAHETNDLNDEDIFELSPFEISTDSNMGYLATASLAGTRLKTDLKDVGSAISVITQEFLEDTGATSNETLLMYTTSGEVGGIVGNYTGVGNTQSLSEDNTFRSPSTNTRVRGLAAADNTRNYFLTSIPWDGYNVSRVDMQRGPNSILFGLGSPAGIINTTLDSANFINSGNIELGVDEWGTNRASINVNRVFLEDQLSIRVAALNESIKYQQKGAFEDDDRTYIALRYEPDFLKRNGALTSLRVNYEKGEIDRNNPRTLPPLDKITPWFSELGGQTYDPYETQDDTSRLPGYGARRPAYSNGDPNPYYEPWVGNFAQVYGGALAIFNGTGDSTPARYYQTEVRTEDYGLGSDGQIDGTIAIPYQRPNSIQGYAQYAIDVGLPFSEFGQYKDFHLTDSSIFDFYNNLIDGPNKGTYQDWEAANITLTQTFLNNKLGIEAVFDKQSYEDGQFSMLAGARYAIYVDIDEIYGNREVNPNLGRPFVSDSAQFGNGMGTNERESMRVTVFGELDFRDFMKETSFFAELLGRHVFTGFFNKDSEETSSRSWSQFGTDDAYGELIGEMDMDENPRAVNTVIYLGGSLLGRDSASGARIPRITSKQIAASGNILRFDPTWNPPVGINPSDIWMNDSSQSTQSENPSNYVGWVEQPINILNADDSQAIRDSLTTEASLTKEEIESKAFVWQGYLLRGAIVGTFGYREDSAKAWSYDAPELDGRSILTDFALPNEAMNIVKGNSKSWSVVAHLDELLPERILPFGLSFYFNESENFQPAAGRADIYATPLPAPNGTTTDYGLLVSTKDGRYSLKVNWYETSVNMATSNAIDNYLWFIGTGVQWGYDHAYQYANDVGQPWVQDFDPRPGQTVDEAAALEAEAVAAWYANPPSQEFLDAWNFEFDENNTRQHSPAGFTATEDTVSSGMEVELVANPLDNWRIALNVAKQESIRSNVGGETLNEFVEERTRVYNTTPAGDIRIWGGGSTTTTLTQWNSTFMSNYSLVQLLEGTAVPELRKWRANLITNYSFNDGNLKGLNIGGAYRWQDEVVIGYPLIEVSGNTTYDLTSPYKGPSEGNIDLWIGYARQITDKIHWKIQFNVRNLGEGNSLIPITTQPDGTPAGVRIAPAQMWSITNTFSF